MPSIENLIVEQKFECCMVEIIGFNFSCVLVGIYNTPRFSFERNFLIKLNSMFEITLSKFDKIIVAGDINIHVLMESTSLGELELILKSHNMYYIVNFPTRISKTKQSSIDNFLTNIVKSKVKVSGCISFNYMLSYESWNDVYQSSATIKFYVFFSIFMHYFDICFPKSKSRKFLNRSNWINYDLIRDKNEIIWDIKNKRNASRVKNNDGLHYVQDKIREFKKHVNVAKQTYY